MKIQLNSPINNLSLGNVSFNFARELVKDKSLSCFFPEKDALDFSAFDEADDEIKKEILISAQNRLKKFNENDPTLKIWHINGSESSFGANRYLYTFYEVDEPTIEEINLVKNHKAVFFSSSEACQIFKDRGLDNVYYIPLGFDEDILKAQCHNKLKDVVHFGLIGKLERRKNTQQIIKLWLKKYGNNPKYQLTCLIDNPFFRKEIFEKIINETLGGKHWNNINFLPRLEKNSEVNCLMKAIDIDLSGCNFNEGWNLPSFNSACLGNICVVGDGMAHKDWAEGENIVKISPETKEECYDGVFFQKGSPFNQGKFYRVGDESIIKSFQEAEEKLKTYNKEIREDLIDKFSYKNSLVKIKEVIKNTN